MFANSKSIHNILLEPRPLTTTDQSLIICRITLKPIIETNAPTYNISKAHFSERTDKKIANENIEESLKILILEDKLSNWH